MAEQTSSHSLTNSPKSPNHSSLKPRIRHYHSNTLNELKSQSLEKKKLQPRYRNSISTESPIVMLTPPNPTDVELETRRLSLERRASNASVASSDGGDSSEPPQGSNHLLPPSEPEPEEVVDKLILQRRPSTITTLSQVIKQIFIEKKVKEDGVPPQIMDGLYLGSIGAAKNLEWLKKNGITHILCVAGGIGPCFPKQFQYKVVEIDDAATEDIATHFESCYEFIENAIHEQNGRVLVHCFAGMSRSVTVVSAYLMKKKRIYAVSALKFVKLRRPQANPNAGFIVQLIKYQDVIGLQPRKNELAMSDNESANEAGRDWFATTQERAAMSDNESANEDDEGEEEEKLDKPKRKSLRGLAFGIRDKRKLQAAMSLMKKEQEQTPTEQAAPADAHSNAKQTEEAENGPPDQEDRHKALTIRLNSPMVKEWENGRRPSLFTAIAKLRGLKHRRVNSTDSTHSNISNMSSTDNEPIEQYGNLLQPNVSPNIVVSPAAEYDHNSPASNVAAVDPATLSPLGDLFLLKEVSNETEADEDDKTHYLEQPVTDNDDDPITPLETVPDDDFPDTPASPDPETDENKAKETGTDL
eukprot:CAMPEP_0197078498 /NCGR_PEP_ID=MMETSP1384-20130603/213151_1 /TAXON_ID=29189 /ORGANISM="Ammonia sp." /LENGTH=583 /DNA_ID=CAMNT_0042517365 /DNA_START=60 /DNA_END=1812 /DNA_ORIENTATION=+